MRKNRPIECIDEGFRELMTPGLPDRFDGPIYTGGEGNRAISDLARLSIDTAKRLAEVGTAEEAFRVVAEPLPPGIGESAD